MELHGGTSARGTKVKSVVAAAGALFLLAATDASAATYRYSASSNRIYIEGGGNATLSDIKAAVPVAPLDLIDPTNKIWLLRANIIISDGSVLNLHGAAAGDVKQLRLQSINTHAADSVVSITADYGGIDMNAVKVTSWNTNTGQPDTEYATYGRAFIRVRSTLAADGITPHESRMDITNSEVSNLGSNLSEAYGLVWKVTGTDPNLTDKVDVLGDIINSHIHDNYYGTYTFGHKGGQWMDSEIDHNVGYGFYVHDESDDMVMDGNNVHDNGSHGIYVAAKSLRAQISNNKTWANTGHGIYLKDASNSATVANNESYQNTDSGLAIILSRLHQVTGNNFHDNAAYGIRMSQSANDNTVDGNDVGHNGRQGIYAYFDPAGGTLPGDDGRPKNNVLSNNNLHDNANEGLRISGGDFNTLAGNTIGTNGSPLVLLEEAKDSKFSGDLPVGTTLKLIGSSTFATAVTVTGANLVPLQIDAYSTANFDDAAGQVYDVSQLVFDTVTRLNARLALTTAKLGTSVTTVTRRPLWVKPTSKIVYVNGIYFGPASDHHKSWKAKAQDAAASVQFTVGDLVPGVPYVVKKKGAAVGTFTANSAGRITFSLVPGSVAGMVYTVYPAP
jgi:poly(beta-D-mannuronate) C5 epimerase